MRRRASVALSAVLIAVVTFVVVASPASARWAYGNGASDLEIDVPVGPGEGTVCTGGASGRAGKSVQAPLEGFVPPPGPYSPITVQVFAGPDIAGATVVGDTLVGGLDGTTVFEAKLTFTTGAPQALDPLETFEGFDDGDPETPVDNYVVYAAAPFSVTFPAGMVNPADTVTIRQSTPAHSAYVSLFAVACDGPTTTTTSTTTSTTSSTTTSTTTSTSTSTTSTSTTSTTRPTTTTTSTTTTTRPSTTTTTVPGPTAAKIDVLPGISPNVVVPSSKLPILWVRLYGSSSLDVTKATGVKLGNASAVTPSWPLSLLLKPTDTNRDGKLDRDYLFVPRNTGITCSTRTVTLTGTASGKAFAGSDSVKPIC